MHHSLATCSRHCRAARTVTHVPFVPLHSSLLGVNFHLPRGKFFSHRTCTMPAPKTICNELSGNHTASWWIEPVTSGSALLCRLLSARPLKDLPTGGCSARSLIILLSLMLQLCHVAAASSTFRTRPFRTCVTRSLLSRHRRAARYRNACTIRAVTLLPPWSELPPSTWQVLRYSNTGLD